MDLKRLKMYHPNENFISKDKYKIFWSQFCICQKLAEEFIEERKERLDWDSISMCQKLSEDFIERNKNLVVWKYISKYQKLSEEFIERNADSVVWSTIKTHQKLSEAFIVKNLNKLYICGIEKYQVLSEDFRKEHDLKISKDNWLYTSKEDKLKAIKNCELYDIEGDYVLGYKIVRFGKYPIINFQYEYKSGNTYETHADYNLDNENSFGFGVWYKKKVEKVEDTNLLKVKIHLDDVAAITKETFKLRCSKVEIL